MTFAALASILLGAVAAYGQTNIKRLLAYSSINNVGFALIGLVAAGPRGASSVLFYMSQYLIDRIHSLPNVEVVVGSEVASLQGDDGKLNSVQLKDRASGAERSVEASYLFSFIGAEPNTDWLNDSGLQLDKIGFVLTGQQIGEDRYPLETSKRGIFAVGDVRSGSVKRVASSVGDGAQVVAAIHSYLAAEEAPIIVESPKSPALA